MVLPPKKQSARQISVTGAPKSEVAESRGNFFFFKDSRNHSEKLKRKHNDNDDKLSVVLVPEHLKEY